MPRFFLSLVLLVLPLQAYGKPIAAALPGAELRGQATFRFLGLPIYQARLYTPGGEPLDWQKELALELTYLRNIPETDLIESTLQEFSRTGASLPVKDQLLQCFADVGKGDRYLAVSNGPDKIMFWRNERQTCTLSHPQIKQRFMTIFLGENTRSPSFTRKLQGS
jgi:hypothetical protein